MFKFELSQVVYYIHNDLIRCSVIMGRSYDDYSTTPPSVNPHKTIKYRFGRDWRQESQLFPSLECLISHLKDNVINE